MTDAYAEFLRSKERNVTPVGFDVDELHPVLFPHQRDIVRWALRLGARDQRSLSSPRRLVRSSRSRRR